MDNYKTLAEALVAVLSLMHKQGKVYFKVDGAGAKYVVTGEDLELVHVDKDNPDGHEWFEMFLVAAPAAEMQVKLDSHGALRVVISSTDYNRPLTRYVFWVVND